MSTERAEYVPGNGIDLLRAAFDRHVYDRHIHDSYAIGVTLHGVQRFWCRGATHDSRPGDVILIGPGETHDGRSGAAGGYAYQMLYVRPEIIEREVGDVLARPATGCGARRPVISDALLSRELMAAWTASAEDPQSLAADERLHRALSRLAVHHVSTVPPARQGRHDQTIQRVRDYLHDRVEDNVRLHELTALSALSRFQLTRAFQATYGLPLHSYFLHVRLNEAKRRLARGDDIAAVSAALGFVDQSHFHRRFKRTCGLTPGQWRSAHGYKTPAAQPRDDAGHVTSFARRRRSAV